MISSPHVHFRSRTSSNPSGSRFRSPGFLPLILCLQLEREIFHDTFEALVAPRQQHYVVSLDCCTTSMGCKCF